MGDKQYDAILAVLDAPSDRANISQHAHLDRAVIDHNEYARPRPYPYTPSDALTLTAGAADTFPVAYTELIPINTFDFNEDEPNRVQIVGLVLELIGANDTYVMEFYKYLDAVYVPIGAVRFARTNPMTRSFVIDRTVRPFNNDDSALYGRMKSSNGANTVTFSLSVARFLACEECVPMSAGVWPTG